MADGVGDQATVKVGRAEISADRRRIVALLKGMIAQLEKISDPA